MPNYLGFSGPGVFTRVDTTAQYPLSTLARDAQDNEYIYLKGASGIAPNALIVYSEGSFATAPAEHAFVGPMAVAMSAFGSGQFGWAQVRGTATVNIAESVTAYNQLYLTSTPGAVDDAIVAGDLIFGMFSLSGASSGTVPAWIDRPYVPGNIPAAE